MKNGRQLSFWEAPPAPEPVVVAYGCLREDAMSLHLNLEVAAARARRDQRAKHYYKAHLGWRAAAHYLRRLLDAGEVPDTAHNNGLLGEYAGRAGACHASWMMSGEPSHPKSPRPERSFEHFSRGAELVRAIHAMWEVNNTTRLPSATKLEHIENLCAEYDLATAEWSYWCGLASDTYGGPR